MASHYKAVWGLHLVRIFRHLGWKLDWDRNGRVQISNGEKKRNITTRYLVPQEQAAAFCKANKISAKEFDRCYRATVESATVESATVEI